MNVALQRLDSDGVATPRPLEDVAAQFGLSARQMWRLATQLKLTRYRIPGRGKRTHLDPDEVRRKLKPQPYR
jgi:hypothetical protein